MKFIVKALEFVGFVFVFALGIFALFSSGCGGGLISTYRETVHTTRGNGEARSTNVAGIVSTTTVEFNNTGARRECVAGYNQQRADGGGAVPNTFGTCTNDVGYGQPHPTMPLWGYGGMYNYAPSAGAPVRW